MTTFDPRLSRPRRLRVDGTTQPAQPTRLVTLALTTLPRLAWVVPLARNGQEQVAYEARIETLGTDGWVEWERLGATTPDNTATPGRALRALARYRWTVRARDERGEWSGWAQHLEFETGPVEFADWGARWIAVPATSVARIPFTIPDTGASLRLHLTAQGLVRALLNGQPVSAATLGPSRVDFTRALYRTFDLGDLVRSGENTLELVVGRGDWARTDNDPRVLASVSADGEIIAATSVATTVAPGQLETDIPFYLERIDLSHEVDWRAANAAVPIEASNDPLSTDTAPTAVSADSSPAIAEGDTIRPIELGRPHGSRVFDVGVNIAGRTRIELVGALPAGTEVRVVHGEHLDTAGHVDTTNLTMPYDEGRTRQAVEYVVAGDPAVALEPWFAYHGFRYFEVFGLPDEADARITARPFHTALQRTGTLITDDDVINTLVRTAERTLLNNVHGIPEDCPTREQAGWTGDTASVVEFVYSAFDVQGFYAKWLGDLRTSQQADGSIPAVAPNLTEVVPSDPVWGAALHRVLVQHWRHVGDRHVVEQNLPALRRWADFLLTRTDAAGLVSRSPISYGHDWLALEQTPPEVHHTGATIDTLEVLAELEDVLGESTEGALRRTQADALRLAARGALFDGTTGVFGNGSQGSYAVAVEAGILTGDDAERARAKIGASVSALGDRVSSGFATTRSVVRALSGGNSDSIAAAIHQVLEPGIGAMLASGPGTFWECWWIDSTNTGTGSLDHVGLGGPFASWAWQRLAGIEPLTDGYREFMVEPRFVDSVHELQLSIDTVRGEISVRYERTESSVTLDLVVPVGASATVRLPGAIDTRVGAGQHRFSAEVVVPRAIRARDVSIGAPVPAPLSADAREGGSLLELAVDAALVQRHDDGIVCMPVPHAQQPGPTYRVGAADATSFPTALVRPDHPLDLSTARFVYALVDLCASPLVTEVGLSLTLTDVAGHVHTTTSRTWPAGVNRVAIDLEGWNGSAAVARVEVALTGDSPIGAGGHPLFFELVGLGWSTQQRTW